MTTMKKYECKICGDYGWDLVDGDGGIVEKNFCKTCAQTIIKLERMDKMKSRTIEIIDNHIKALEEELEWYQEKNQEWQEKCERLREQLRWHSMDEKPPLETANCSKTVLLDVDYVGVFKMYYNYLSELWVGIQGKQEYFRQQDFKNINARWCYIPDDNLRGSQTSTKRGVG